MKKTNFLIIILALFFLIPSVSAFTNPTTLFYEPCDTLNTSIWGYYGDFSMDGRCNFRSAGWDTTQAWTLQNFSSPNVGNGFINLSYIFFDVYETNYYGTLPFGFGNYTNADPPIPRHFLYHNVQSGHTDWDLDSSSDNTTGTLTNGVQDAEWIINLVIYDNCSIFTYINGTLYNVLTNCSVDNFPISTNGAGQLAPNENYWWFDDVKVEGWQNYILNFTIIDEESGVTIDFATFNYQLIEDVNMYSGSTTTGNFTVSEYLSNTNYVLTYWSDYYPARKKYFTLTDSTPIYNNYTIYTGNISNTNLVTILIKDYETNKYVENAVIRIQKSINNIYTEVFSDLTDITGAVYLYLNTSDTHKVIVSKDGYGTQEGLIYPTVYPYTYTIYIKPSSLALNYLFENVSYLVTPQTSIFNTSTPTINLTTYSPEGAIQYFNISMYNGTTMFTSQSYTTTGGTISITPNIASFKNSFFWVNITIKVTDYDEWSNNYKFYYDAVTYPNTSFMQGMGSIKNEFSQSTRIMMAGLVAIFVAIIFVFLVPQVYAVIIAFFVMALFSFAGFIPSWIVWLPVTVGLIFWLAYGDGQSGGYS